MDIRIAAEPDLCQITKYDRHIPTDRLADCIRQGFADVLADGGQILGILRWSLFWQSIPFLDLIYLDENLRGKGHGRTMMHFWETQMRSQGFDHVLLSTQEDESAKYFYEKLGYSLCGSFLPPDQEALELIYRKELTP